MIPKLSVTDRYRLIELNPMPSQVCEPDKVLWLQGRKTIGYATVDKLASIPKLANGVMLPKAAYDELMAAGR